MGMAKIKNSDTTKCWQGCGETGSPTHCWWYGHSGKQFAISLKTKYATTIWPNSCTHRNLGEMKTYVHTKYLCTNVYSSFICESQKLETTKIFFFPI